MAESPPDKLILVITGATLRAEQMDRPLAYRLRDAIVERLGADSDWSCLVVSDIWYLNSDELHEVPAISLGGPGVNAVAQYWLKQLPNALAVDNVFLIQLDATQQDHRASLWGMDHETTVEAIETFLEKGYLDHFLTGVRQNQ